MDYFDSPKLTALGQRETALEEMMADLLRALRRKRGFGLFFVQCHKVQGEEIIATVRERLPQKRVQVFELHRQSESLYDEMLGAYQTETFDIAFVVGVDQAVLGYEDTRRIAGWSSQEIYTTSWKGVPILLGHLNRQREAFAENIPACIVFLVPSFVIDYFVQRAADFFDWRSGFFKVPESEETLQQSVKEMVGGDFEEYKNLSNEDRLARIFELKEKIQQPTLDQTQKAELLREQGRLFSASQEYYKALDCYDRSINLKSDYHEAWNSRGNDLRNLERYEEAIASYENSLNIHPDDCQTLMSMGITLCDHLHRYSDALSVFGQILKIEPENDVAWNNRGIALRNLERYEEAIESYDKALNYKPDEAEAWVNRGDALSALERYEEAIASYDKALQHKPDYHYAWHNRGFAFEKLGQYEEEIASCDKVIAIKPDFHKAWYNRGAALGNLGRYEEAIASYDEGLNYKPDFHKAWHNRGAALGNLGRYEEAIASYDEGLNYKPDDAKAWFNRGNALRNLERYEESIASYENSLNLYPDDCQTLMLMGATLCDHLHRYSDALSVFEQILEIEPENYDAWNNRGIALRNLERYEEAIASYDEALQHKPDYHAAWNNRGNALRSLERYEEAIASYDEAIQHKPDFHYAWNGRGNALFNLKRYEEAIASYENSLNIHPDDCKTLMSMGITLCDHLHRYSDALSVFGQILKIEPENYVAWNNRGIALRNLERYEEAIASYDKALQHKPDYHEARNALAKAYLFLGQPDKALEALEQIETEQCQDPQILSTKLMALIQQGDMSQIAPLLTQLINQPEFFESLQKSMASNSALNLQPAQQQMLEALGGVMSIDPQDLITQITEFNALMSSNPEEAQITLQVQALQAEAQVLMSQDNYAEALLKLDEALKHKPDDYDAWSLRGNALGNLERYEEAIASYDKALQHQPDDHYAWNSRAVALLYLKRASEAITDFEKALELDPDYDSAHYNKACGHGLLGQLEPALFHLQKAIDLDPEWARNSAQTDTDFDRIRHHPSFQALLQPPTP